MFAGDYALTLHRGMYVLFIDLNPLKTFGTIQWAIYYVMIFHNLDSRHYMFRCVMEKTEDSSAYNQTAVYTMLRRIHEDLYRIVRMNSEFHIIIQLVIKSTIILILML